MWYTISEAKVWKIELVVNRNLKADNVVNCNTRHTNLAMVIGLD
jgi:hypothetical protein